MRPRVLLAAPPPTESAVPNCSPKSDLSSARVAGRARTTTHARARMLPEAIRGQTPRFGIKQKNARSSCNCAHREGTPVALINSLRGFGQGDGSSDRFGGRFARVRAGLIDNA